MNLQTTSLSVSVPVFHDRCMCLAVFKLYCLVMVIVSQIVGWKDLQSLLSWMKALNGDICD